MRRVLTFTVLSMLALTTVAVAGDNQAPVRTASTTDAVVPVVQVSQSRGVFQPVRRSRQGFVGRIMELERRKNAWLRRSFGG